MMIYEDSTKKAGVNSVKPLYSLIGLIERGFELVTAEKCSLWGIYPVNNGLFMKDTITTDLRFIMGSFWGIINPQAYKDLCPEKKIIQGLY